MDRSTRTTSSEQVVRPKNKHEQNFKEIVERLQSFPVNCKVVKDKNFTCFLPTNFLGLRLLPLKFT